MTDTELRQDVAQLLRDLRKLPRDPAVRSRRAWNGRLREITRGYIERAREFNLSPR